MRAMLEIPAAFLTTSDQEPTIGESVIAILHSGLALVGEVMYSNEAPGLWLNARSYGNINFDLVKFWLPAPAFDLRARAFVHEMRREGDSYP